MKSGVVLPELAVVAVAVREELAAPVVEVAVLEFAELVVAAAAAALAPELAAAVAVVG